MKKLITILALAAVCTLSAQAQNNLGNALGNVLGNIAGTLYSAPVSLDGTYQYNGAAVSVVSSEGGILTNLAGTAVTSGIESQIDEYLAKVGIKPGAMTFTFNAADDTFVLNVAGMSFPGTYKVSSAERVVTLTFGRKLQYLSMTGVLNCDSKGARMLFTADKAVALLKKLASKMGESSSQLGAIAKLADGYDSYRVGFRLTK